MKTKIRTSINTLYVLTTTLLITVMLTFSGCTSTVNSITNKLTSVAKIGTSTYSVAKVFYKSGKTILVSGGIYNLLPLTTQAKLKALDTTLTTYDAFRANVILIIEAEVGKENYVIEEEGNETIIAIPIEQSILNTPTISTNNINNTNNEID